MRPFTRVRVTNPDRLNGPFRIDGVADEFSIWDGSTGLIASIRICKLPCAHLGRLRAWLVESTSFNGAHGRGFLGYAESISGCGAA